MLVLLDAFDARRIDPAIVTIAWIRNWTERWLERPWLDRMDLLLCSSRGSEAQVARARPAGRPTLFPLATNPARFRPTAGQASRDVDYVFTGNRWGEERAIERALRPRDHERAAVYGRGWDAVPELKPHLRRAGRLRGAAGASTAPPRSSSTTLRATREPHGAVNSRVFDALACGTPVVTNGVGGRARALRRRLPRLGLARRRCARSSTRCCSNPSAANRWRGGTASRCSPTTPTRSGRSALTELLARLRAECFVLHQDRGAQLGGRTRAGETSTSRRALARELRRRGHRALIQVLARVGGLRRARVRRGDRPAGPEPSHAEAGAVQRAVEHQPPRAAGRLRVRRLRPGVRRVAAVRGRRSRPGPTRRSSCSSRRPIRGSSTPSTPRSRCMSWSSSATRATCGERS